MASLEPVGRISEIGLVAVLNPHAIEGVNSLETLLTFGRKNPGKLTFASSGIGTTSHLAGMLFSLRTGIEIASYSVPRRQCCDDGCFGGPHSFHD